MKGICSCRFLMALIALVCVSCKAAAAELTTLPPLRVVQDDGSTVSIDSKFQAGVMSALMPVKKCLQAHHAELKEKVAKEAKDPKRRAYYPPLLAAYEEGRLEDGDIPFWLKLRKEWIQAEAQALKVAKQMRDGGDTKEAEAVERGVAEYKQRLRLDPAAENYASKAAETYVFNPGERFLAALRNSAAPESPQTFLATKGVVFGGGETAVLSENKKSLVVRAKRETMFAIEDLLNGSWVE